MPYRVEPFPYGFDGRPLPTKVYPNGVGNALLTADEQAVWRYVQWLVGERERLIDVIVAQAQRIAEQNGLLGKKAEGAAGTGGKTDERFKKMGKT